MENDIVTVQKSPIINDEKSKPVTPALLKWIDNMASKHEKIPLVMANNIKKIISSRSDFGKEKYGSILMSFNGRDADVDGAQEIADFIQYMFQLSMEGSEPSVHTKMLLEIAVIMVKNWPTHEL